LIQGEDPAAYQAMLKRVSIAVQPKDFLDEIWVRDIVDLSWETFRLRRLKAGLLNTGLGEGLVSVLASLRYPKQASLADHTLVERWVNGDGDARQKVGQRLTAGGFSMEEVVATALSKNLDDFERVDRMIASAEARRNNALRELDRQRATLGAALRAAVEEAEDAEFTDVVTGAAANGSEE
jgi:hypothetical protein